MNRFHVHVGVADLDASIAFYSELFAARPAVVKPDYAKWMLDDPRVNFAISQGHAGTGVEHLGLEAETPEALDEVQARLAGTGGRVVEEGETTCCYARSRKSWVADPDGVVWETFHTSGEATTYGATAVDPALPASAKACCP